MGMPNIDRAILKALYNGWWPVLGEDARPTMSVLIDYETCTIQITTDALEVVKVPFNVYQIIYSHEFAKALWGDVHDANGFSYSYNIGTDKQEDFKFEMRGPTWKLKLAQMVIADDPIAYLGENL